MNLSSDVVAVIEQMSGQQIDRTSFSYNRFLTHLRALLVKLTTQSASSPHSSAALFDDEISAVITKQAPEVKPIVAAITQLIEQRLELRLSFDEQVYLMLHVWRILSR